jgi:hypothetical protein
LNDREKNSSSSNTLASGKDLYERAIASRKRRLEQFRETHRTDRTSQLSRESTKKQFLVGLKLSDVDSIRREVWMRFFDEANLSKTVEREWGSVLSSRKMPDFYLDESLTLALTMEYAKAISRAASILAAGL